MDMHTHFLRDDTRLEGFVRSREAVGKAGWNPALAGKPQTLDDLKFANYFKEIYFDSDTKVALVSGSGSEDPRDWFLTNEMKADARAKVNRLTGSKRMFAHAIFMPGMDGWLDDVDRAIATSQAGLVQGLYRRRQHQQATGAASRGGWTTKNSSIRSMKGSRRRVSSTSASTRDCSRPRPARAIRICCRMRMCATWGRRRKIGRSSISSSITRRSDIRGAPISWGWSSSTPPGRIDWVSDLAEIPEKHGVTNVYADLGQIFAQSTVAEPRLCAAMMGMLVKGLGADHVVWGTDAVWTGSPQWQIEALRRLEIPDAMRKKYGYAPLGPADGPVKRAIFGENSARIYKYQPACGTRYDRISVAKATYEREGPGRTNLRYGYVQGDDVG